jgi:hypothetical protein
MQNYTLFFKYTIILTQTYILHSFLINYALFDVFLFKLVAL